MILITGATGQVGSAAMNALVAAGGEVRALVRSSASQRGYVMTDEFRIESRTTEAIVVRHVAHGHRYAFHVSEQPHRSLLCVGPVLTNGKAALPRSAFQTAARAFAEREARKVSMID